MNYHLFIDNFRGFSNACIPITDVNFLVGQNSTGKTSVLGLLKLFTGPRFLFQQEFGHDEVNFGHFSDMVSAHSEDKRFFRIGVIWDEPSGKKDETIALGWLSTFVEDEGLPRLSRYTFCRAAHIVSMKVNGGDIQYRTEQRPESLTSEGILTTFLPKWIEEHSTGVTNYENLAVPKGWTGKIPLMIALSMIGGIRDSGQKKDRSRKGFMISPPETFPAEIVWIAPIRTKPRRTYDELTLDFSPEGGHTPYLIRKMLSSELAAAHFHSFIERVGLASGLFEDVRIESFGRSATAPFEVDIVLDGEALNLSTVGYGVSQSLPVLVEVLARPKGTWFAIQQPEVHLHPRAQAALGDVIFEMAVREHKRFLVETHSDFTIDRFRMNYQDEMPEKPDSQVLFFERRDKRNVVTPLSIAKSGDLPANQPTSYREFFVREELRLLGI